MPWFIWNMGRDLIMGAKNEFEAAWLDERAEYFAGVHSDILKLKFQGVFNGKNIAIVGSWNNAGEINQILLNLGLKLTQGIPRYLSVSGRVSKSIFLYFILFYFIILNPIPLA